MLTSRKETKTFTLEILELQKGEGQEEKFNLFQSFPQHHDMNPAFLDVAFIAQDRGSHRHPNMMMLFLRTPDGSNVTQLCLIQVTLSGVSLKIAMLLCCFQTFNNSNQH